jgi:integrase/recombinase XerD
VVGAARARAAPGQPERAVAKSRFPRTVPASKAVLAGDADYQHERDRLVGGDGTEMALVNLYHAPLGGPMTYRTAKGFFERLARECGFPVQPHMLRHAAATDWVRAGADLDVVQALLGHASLASTASMLDTSLFPTRRWVVFEYLAGWWLTRG